MKKQIFLVFIFLIFTVVSFAQVEITSGGSSTAYTLNVPGVFPLRNGLQVTFKAHLACSASPTINVTGTGAIQIRKQGNTTPLSAGDILANQIVTLVYDGAFWQMISPLGSSVSIPTSYWDPNGIDIFNNNSGGVAIGTNQTFGSKLRVSGNEVTFDNNATGIYLTSQLSIGDGFNWFSYNAGGGPTGAPTMRYAFSPRNNANTGTATFAEIIQGKLANSDAGYISFTTRDSANNLAERMRINSNGNMGVGIVNPSQRLHVNGNFHLAFAFMPGGNAGTSGQILTSQGPGNPPLWQNAASQGLVSGSGTATRIAFWDGTSSLSSNANFNWDNTNSRLGIGTSSPVVATHIYGTDNTTSPVSNAGSPQTGLRLHNHGLTNNNYSSIAFSTFLSNSAIAEMSKIVGINVNHTAGSQRGDLVFMTNNNGISEKMRITGSGNVGIGTGGGGSLSLLHVHSISGNGNLRLTSASTGQSDTDGFSMSNDGSLNLFMTQHETADWYFVTNNSTTAMTIFPNANIGIGSPTATSRLEVRNSTLQTTAQFFNTFGSTGNKIAVYGQTTGTNTGTNYGAAFDATGSTGINYGISGLAYGNSGTKIGVHGNAIGTGTNWAGFFEGGDVYVTNRIRIGSSASAPIEIFHASTTDSDVDLETYSTTESSSLHIKRARGTVSSPAIPSPGDFYGGIGFQGWNGSSFLEGARIQAAFPATPSATSMPGRLEFWTTPTGSSTSVLRMTIADAGNVGIATNPITTANLYVQRSSTDIGANYSTIFGLRTGVSGNANAGGTSWTVNAVDAALKGQSSWGNTFTAGVAGYNYLGDYTGVQVAGVIGLNLSATTIFGALAYRDNNIDYAGYFSGNVRVSGNHQIIGSLSKGSGTFMIDHPLDPQNKYLYHSFVESPDMMNIYNGNITTNASGIAEVALPSYFEALNMEFRYQLTVIGDFAQAIILEKVNGNKFKIKTDKPNIEVSWQVTGVRKDPYANKNRVVPEVEKEERNKGKYLHPEAYGVSPERGIGYQKNESIPKNK